MIVYEIIKTDGTRVPMSKKPDLKELQPEDYLQQAIDVFDWQGNITRVEREPIKIVEREVK